MRILLVPMLLLACFDLQAADISNFVSGRVCHGDDGQESICEQSEDIQVNGESECDWSGELRRCTWFGYEFDYENAETGLPLVCAYKRSVESSEGNYQSVRQKDATKGTMELELDGASGHFYNPMYQLYSTARDGQPGLIITYISCSIGGEDVFDMTFRLHIEPG